MSFWNRQKSTLRFIIFFLIVVQRVTTELIIWMSISFFFIWMDVQEKIIAWLDMDIILLTLINSFSFWVPLHVNLYFLLQTTFHNPNHTPNNSKQEKEERDFPGGPVVKNHLPMQATVSIPGLGGFPMLLGN